MNDLAEVNDIDNPDIAIIGISGRFPGAQNLEQFWQNLRDGVESVSFFSDQELESAGVDPAVLSDPNYIKAKPILENIDLFDASFFDINPREAEVMDPQHRIFLECAWEALENAGYDCETYPGSIAVYAGSSINQYLLNIYSNCDIIELVDATQINIGNFNDYLPTRVSYKLNLTGPSYAVQSSCSSSLVAVHVACQSLLNHECDMALAGGISITNLSPESGYRYQKEGILSPDGHCRAFDVRAQGTIFGSGVGIVVLKRLKDALADGDCIHALIKGSAINNDGSLKAGFTAPSVDSQTEVIVEALGAAGVEAETITYVEAHGTGTPIGDPIEIKALTKAFRTSARKQGFCAIGSVKTNIGHLDAAAGIGGLIKTILALKHKQIPPSLHFKEPNPQIDFAKSPFYINTTLSEWKTGVFPRRAGVTSLGFGGTNAHVILEEAPSVEKIQSRGVLKQGRRYQLLVLSGKTRSALETATVNLADYLKQHPALNLADVAYTLQVGRRDFNYRRMLVCQNIEDAVKALETQEPQKVFTQFQSPCSRSVVFMFSGQGAQYVNMGRELYQTESKFREMIDHCCEKLKPHLLLDLRSVLYPSQAQAEAVAEQLKQTYITQSALFVIEYALAQLWMAWGVRPSAMIGHSIGEYVAACLAGVFSLEDALMLVATRGQMMQQLPSGAMLAVALPEKKVLPVLGEKLSLAAINAPEHCVVSGSRSAINDLHNRLTEQKVDCRLLHTSHAFHSDMMEPIVDLFMAQVKKVNLKAPQIPFVSNVTGIWITAAEATDPSYWARHLRQTVCFSEGITQLLQKPEQIFLEVGPGQTLSTLTRQHLDRGTQEVVLSSLRHPKEQHSDVAFALNTLGKLWQARAQIDWSGFYALQRHQRVPLPTYPFERQRYWIERQTSAVPVTTRQDLHKKPNIADWFYVPSWKKSIQFEPLKNRDLAEQNFCWLVFVDECGLGELLVKHLQQHNQNAIAVMVGDKFSKLSDRAYCINPQKRDDYDALLQALSHRDLTPQMIAHLWGITANHQTRSEIESFETNQYLGFYSLLFLAQAVGQQGITDPLQMLVVTNNIHDVTGDESLCPKKATVIGPCKVIPQEYTNIICRSIDVVLPQLERQKQKLIDQLVAEVTIQPTDLVIAYRGHHRWVQTFEAVHLEEAIAGKTRLRQKGVYLITGGLGGIGLELAQYLAQTVQAKLVLVGRSGLPEKDEWEQWLATHDYQDSVSIKIKKVQALEELGASVLVKSADVADFEQMQSVIAQVSEHFGEIHGIVHAAGVAGGGIIQLKTPQAAASVMASKVKGTLVLDAIFRDVKLDFLVICSSDSSILGELGQVDYCAANVFLDCFAHRNFFRQGSFTVSINWCGWRDMGMLVNTVVPDELKKRREETIKEAITTKEGVEAFRRIIYSGLPQVVVSTRDFQTRIEQNYSKISLEEQLTDLEEQLASARFSKPTHPRPNLGNDYVAPRTRVEQSVANIWQQLLGIECLGIYDNFFELGGHSLLATQVISQLRKSFPVDLPLRSLFFEYSTIAKLAELIEQMIIEKIEQLSEEEVQRLLGV